MGSITIFGITIPVNPVAFSLFGWDIYWYGILIAVGVLLALFYGMKNGERLGINTNHIFDSFLVVLPLSILSARAYYIIFDPASSFKDFFNFSGHGFRGLAIYGGVIGAAITIFIMQRIYKFSLLAALDITSIGFLIGQGIGRWGNFVNQEAYGTFTGSDWFGMTGSKIAAEVGSNNLVHPCFLYESLWCILGFFVLHYLSKRRAYKGQIALCYGAWYGFERTFIELLRTDSLMLGQSGIRVSSLLSALLCIACVGLLVVFKIKGKKHKNDSEYSPVFVDGFEEVISQKAEDTEQKEVE
ncbi:MAG: prolipoprotein diacylglyceryl transferase [Clostridia bacterium]|nr:prolipoprotein diacylglyceryl transferase [Clostridia bacterium]